MIWFLMDWRGRKTIKTKDSTLLFDEIDGLALVRSSKQDFESIHLLKIFEKNWLLV